MLTVAVAEVVPIVIVGTVMVGIMVVTGAFVVFAGALVVAEPVPVAVPDAVGLPVRPSIVSSVSPLSAQANRDRAAPATSRGS